jgi:hypothetical protein
MRNLAFGAPAVSRAKGDSIPIPSFMGTTRGWHRSIPTIPNLQTAWDMSLSELFPVIPVFARIGSYLNVYLCTSINPRLSCPLLQNLPIY